MSLDAAAIIVALLEHVTEWHFEDDRGRAVNCCYSCGATYGMSEERRHKGDCKLAATIDAAHQFFASPLRSRAMALHDIASAHAVHDLKEIDRLSRDFVATPAGAVTVLVNAVQKDVFCDFLSYADVVQLAVGPGRERVTYSVAFCRGHVDRSEGCLAPGCMVRVRAGMIFSVAHTGNA